MQLDYCPGGEVFRYLRAARKFDLDTARFYAAEIVLILEFLHNVQGIAYRDMKPENILIDAEGHLKLVDFGFAKKVETSMIHMENCWDRIVADLFQGKLTLFAVHQNILHPK